MNCCNLDPEPRLRLRGREAESAFQERLHERLLAVGERLQ